MIRNLLAVAIQLLALGTTPAAAQSEERFQYDAAGRLIEASLGGKAIRYTYDAAGNLLERKVVPVPEPGATLVLAAAGALLLLRHRRHVETA